MKLRLEALSPTDGIGIIRSGRTLRLVRPPYSLAESPVLAEDSLQDAILKHGFFASQQEFGDWHSAIDFLKHQVVKVRRALGHEIPESIPESDILDAAPIEVLNGFLDRVQHELIPQRLFGHAENFLLALLTSTVLTRPPEMRSRATKLLRSNKEARNQAESAVSELATRDIRFRSLEKHGELEQSARLAEQIRQRGCIFSLTS
jgi:hypothetical protein